MKGNLLVDIKKKLILALSLLATGLGAYFLFGSMNSAAKDTSRNQFFEKISADKETSLNKKNSENITQMLYSKYPNNWSVRGLFNFNFINFDFWNDWLYFAPLNYSLVNCTDDKYYCLKSDPLSLSIPRKCSDFSEKGWFHAGNEMVVIRKIRHPLEVHRSTRDEYIIYEKSNPDVIILYRTGIEAFIVDRRKTKTLPEIFAENLPTRDITQKLRPNGLMQQSFIQGMETMGACSTV
jgi:hypothetical protein